MDEEEMKNQETQEEQEQEQIQQGMAHMAARTSQMEKKLAKNAMNESKRKAEKSLKDKLKKKKKAAEKKKKIIGWVIKIGGTLGPFFLFLIIMLAIIGSVLGFVTGIVDAIKGFGSKILDFFTVSNNGIQINDEQVKSIMEEIEAQGYEIDEKYVKKFLEADAATTLPKTGTTGSQGIIEIRKTDPRNEEGTEASTLGTVLQYQDYETFSANPDGTHFSIDSAGNLVVATYTSNQETGGEVYYLKTINYSALVSQFRVPYTFFLDLYMVTQTPEFVYQLAERVEQSKIVLTLQDTTTVIHKEWEDEEGNSHESWSRTNNLVPLITKADTLFYTKTLLYNNTVTTTTASTSSSTTTTTTNKYSEGVDQEPYFKNKEFKNFLQRQYPMTTNVNSGTGSPYNSIVDVNSSMIIKLFYENVDNEVLIQQFQYILYLMTGYDFGVTELDIDLSYVLAGSAGSSLSFEESYWFPIAKEDIKSEYFTGDGLTAYTTKDEIDNTVITSPMGPRVRGEEYSQYENNYTITWKEYEELSDPDKELAFSQKNGTVVADQHTGIDIGQSKVNGYDVIASKAGTVSTYALSGSSNYGNYIDIKHSDGSVTRYAHLQDIKVENGQKVSQGDVIGTMGTTGASGEGSYSRHLHFEILINGEQVDPLEYINFSDPWKEVTYGIYGNWTGGTREQFIQVLAPYAVESMEKQHIYASVTIAQGILESGSGSSGLSINHNNFFGMKGGGDANASSYEVGALVKTSEGNEFWDGTSVVMNTGEEVNGENIRIKAFFRKYQNMAQSVFDHGRLLTTSRYTNAGVTQAYEQGLGPEEQITRIRAAGYATDSKYVSKVMNLINDYNLQQYDNMTSSDFELAGVSTQMQQLITEAIRICNDDRYTYSQNNRFGEFQFDCSSFVQRLYRQFFPEITDVPMQTTSYGTKYQVNAEMALENLRPGDVLWRNGHVGLYIGNGKIAEAKTANLPAADQIKITEYTNRFTKIYRFAS